MIEVSGISLDLVNEKWLGILTKDIVEITQLLFFRESIFIRYLMTFVNYFLPALLYIPAKLVFSVL